MTCPSDLSWFFQTWNILIIIQGFSSFWDNVGTHWTLIRFWNLYIQWVSQWIFTMSVASDNNSWNPLSSSHFLKCLLKVKAPCISSQTNLIFGKFHRLNRIWTGTGTNHYLKKGTFTTLGIPSSTSNSVCINVGLVNSV